MRAITAAVAGAPAGAAGLIEDEALAVAREADPRAVAELMRRFAHALDPDAADAAALARFDRRGITLSPLPDGSVHLRGLADEVTGALLATAIDAANPPVSGDRRTAAQSRMDALAEICRKFLGSPDAPMTGGGHAHLILTVDAATFTYRHTPARPATTKPARTVTRAVLAEPLVIGGASIGNVAGGGGASSGAGPGARCAGWGRSPGRPRAGSAVTPMSPTSRSTTTAARRWSGGRNGSSTGPSARR